MAVTSPAGFAVNFDGTDDFINLSSANFGTPADVTIECWVKFDVLGSKIHFIVTNSQDDFNNGFTMWFAGAGSILFTAAASIPTKGSAATSTTLVIDRWYHVVGVHDSVNDEVRIYLDGVLEQTVSYTGGITYTSGRELLLAKQKKAVSQSARFLDGQMSEVRFWNTVRTPVQIKNSRLKEIDAAAQTGLIGYWRHNEGTGTTTTDLEGTVGDGTLTSGPTFVAAPPDVDQFAARIKRAFKGDGVVGAAVGSDVTIKNVQTGFKARADGGSSVVESGGSISLVGVAPYTKLEILNASDRVQEEIDPNGGGIGDDVWDAGNIGDDLHRVVEGLLIYDPFIDRSASQNNVDKPALASAEVPNWNEREAGAADLFIEFSSPNFFLGHTASNVTSTLEKEDPELPGDYIIQANLQPRSGSGFVFLDANLNAVGAPGGADFYDMEASVAADTVKARVVENDALSESTSISQTIDSPNAYQFRLVGELIGGPSRSLRVYMAQNGAALNGLTFKHGVLTLKVTHVTSIIINEPFYGISLHEQAAAFHLWACGRQVKVTNLPAGFKIQIDSDTPIVETAGEVITTVDTRELPFPVLKVLNASNAVQGTINPLSGDVGWEGGGGDEYIFESTAPPPPPLPPPLPALTTPVFREELAEPFQEFIQTPEIAQMFLPMLPLNDLFFVPKFIFDIGPLVTPVAPQLDPFLAAARKGYVGQRGGPFGWWTHGGQILPETPVAAGGTGLVGIGADGTIVNTIGGMAPSGAIGMPRGLYTDSDSIRVIRLNDTVATSGQSTHGTGNFYTKQHRHIGSFGYYWRTITRVENLNLTDLATVFWGFGVANPLTTPPFPLLIRFEVIDQAGTLSKLRCVVSDEASSGSVTITFQTAFDMVETAHLLEIVMVPGPTPQARFYVDGGLVFFENTLSLPPDSTGRTDAAAEGVFGTAIFSTNAEVAVRFSFERQYAFPYNDITGA